MGQQLRAVLDNNFTLNMGIYLDTYTQAGCTSATLNTYYLARPIAGATGPRPGRKSGDVGWLDLRSPPPLAFPPQRQAIDDAALTARAWS